MSHICKELPISDLLSIITTPIPGDNPFGTNINYDPDFDLVKNEIAKLAGTDYDAIEKAAKKILKEKSKDIRVLSFLSFSYLKSDNWEPFSDIFDGLGTLVEQNYDALYPDRDRAKQLAIKWLAEERYTLLLEEKKPTEADYEHIARMLAGLTKIKPILEAKFPEGSPFPSVLYKFVQQWERTCKPKPKVETPPPPPPQTATPRQTAEQPQGATPAAPQSSASPAASSAGAPAEAMETPKQAQMAIRRAGQFLLEKERDKSMGYRIMRAVRWDLLDKLPPAEAGKIKLEGPNPQQRAYFQKLLAEKDWKTILEKGEAAFTGGALHFWLDLQRMVATAGKELGPEYNQVHAAILIETALLCKRLPDLVNLQFSDGTPFCDDATKDWIATEVQSAAGSGSGSGSAAIADPLVEEQREINKLTSAGQIEGALSLVKKHLRSSSNVRDNFRRAVSIAGLLLKAKQPDIAVTLLEELEQTIERHGLAIWDPAIAVEAWSTLAMAYKVAKVQKPQNIQAAMQEKLLVVLGKISQSDPEKAYSLSK